MISPSDVSSLINDRGELYGNAHEITGKILQPVASELVELLSKWPALWIPWIMILNKLVRLLFSPTHLDSWMDIQGYAELAMHSLRKENRNG